VSEQEFTIKLSEDSARAFLSTLRTTFTHKLVADQIEAQLPKPLPPEPTGDVLLVDGEGWIWFRDGDEWGTNDDPCQDRLPWRELHKWGVEKVYRREDTEATEPSVPVSKLQDLALHCWYRHDNRVTRGERDAYFDVAKRVEKLIEEASR